MVNSSTLAAPADDRLVLQAASLHAIGQYRTKAASIRQLARSQLDNVSEVGTMIAELITRLDELSSSEQAAVLRDQIGPAFGNEAKTVGAAASVLEKSAS